MLKWEQLDRKTSRFSEQLVNKQTKNSLSFRDSYEFSALLVLDSHQVSHDSSVGPVAIPILCVIHHCIGLGEGVTFLPHSGMTGKFLVLDCLVSFEYTQFFQQPQCPLVNF